ncbi:UDP-glucose 4-epimerase GalE [Akkermansiaceae bacterium]|nr:UDP-glucose 4-epimerase GalE [Akkermansiaceae bacterium]
MNILVTGGNGFIGTHTIIALHEAGYRPIIIDNLSNSNPESLDRVERLAGGISFPFYQVDLRDACALDQIFREHTIDSVIHFAGLKAVGESSDYPLKYYSNNLESTLSLLKAMENHGCYQLVFSSSATVYGVPQTLPLTEDHPLSATNPYGRTKLMIEQILNDLAQSDPRWCVALLRYFNPVGAHQSGQIGESPLGPPDNLFPCILQFMTGVRPELTVFGADYPTSDGSGVRDYLHVCDLAKGHIAALKNLNDWKGAIPINLGSGKGYSVMEVIQMFEDISGRNIAYEIGARRVGDVASCYADPSRAKKMLGWKSEFTLRQMVVDSLRWQNLENGGNDLGN